MILKFDYSVEIKFYDNQGCFVKQVTKQYGEDERKAQYDFVIISEFFKGVVGVEMEFIRKAISK